MPNYKLIYFDYQGFAEPIRLVLTHLGIPFEDVRHKYESGWQKKISTPFGMLPILEVDGKELPESMAILRYIGEQHGLLAANPWDRAMGDAMATSWTDMHPLFAACDFSTRRWDVDKVVKLIEEMVKPRLKFFDDHLSKSKSGYLTGDKITWADFHVYTFLELLKRIFRVPIDAFPNVFNFYKKINDLPSVKSWHQNHPNDTWGGEILGPYGDK